MASPGRRGPLVHRTVHHAAYLLLGGVVAFFLGNGITQWAWDYYRSSPTPVYSLLSNYISDLGAIHCGSFSGRYVCSPGHLVFGGFIVLMGLCLLLAAPLLKTAFAARRSRTIGLGLFGVAGIGAMGVGFFPEDFIPPVHVASAVLAFAGSNLAIIVLAFAMMRDTRWDGYRLFSVVCGLVGLVALILLGVRAWGPLEAGGMERLIVAPVLLWATVVGVHLARIPTFSAPSVDPTSG